MTKPDCQSQMQNITAAFEAQTEKDVSLSTAYIYLDQLRKAEALLVDAKSKLNDLPKLLAETYSDREQRRLMARFLYWNIPEIGVGAIAEDLLGVNQHELRVQVGNSDAGTLLCDKCSQPIEFVSRTHMIEAHKALKRSAPRWMEGYRVLCKPCEMKIPVERDAKNGEWRERRQEAIERHEERLRELRYMPYKKYLQTPEWEEKRSQKLKSARYRCQLCNANGEQLDVHHRTYDRKGEEYMGDLIVLCRPCHTLFHERSRISKE